MAAQGTESEAPLRFAGAGDLMAARIFDRRRGHGGGRPSEAHLSEAQLAQLLAVAIEFGYDRGRASLRTTIEEAVIGLAAAPDNRAAGRASRLCRSVLDTLPDR